MSIGIYKIQNKINGKMYIGQSIDINRRWGQHRRCSHDITNSSYFNPLYTDMRTFGLDNFSFEILEECKKSELNKKELFWIRYFKTNENGYNINAAEGRNQRIVLYDIKEDKKLFFTSFEQVELFLHNNNITTSKKLNNFLKRSIIKKDIIYNKYKIYFDKE